MNKYIESSSVYAYPSSNSKDGGSVNSEVNLSSIFKSLSIRNHVVNDTLGSYDNDLLKVEFKGSGKFSLSSGSCFLDGRLVSIKSFEFDYSLANKGDTRDLYLVINKDSEGQGNMLGDYVRRGTINDSQLELSVECQGVAITDDVSDRSSKGEDYLKLCTVTKTSEGYDVEVSKDRFRYIDWFLLDSTNELPDHINIDKISKLLNSTLYKAYIRDSDGDLCWSDGTNEYSVNDINERTGVSAPGGNHGMSPLLARMDHTHDYIRNENYFNPDQYAFVSVLPESDISTDKIYLLETSTVGTYQQWTYDGADWTQISPNVVVTPQLISTELKVGKYTDSNDVEHYSLEVFTSDQGIDNDRSVKCKVNGCFSAEKVFNAVWNDYAELYKKYDINEDIQPGDVICKVKGSDSYTKSSVENSRLVVGVCSDTYGHLLGGDKDLSLEENLNKYIPVALSGRVYVSVVPNIKIEEGDIMIVSAFPGKAIKCDSNFDSKGLIIGKSLEDSDGSKDKILIQAMLG